MQPPHGKSFTLLHASLNILLFKLAYSDYDKVKANPESVEKLGYLASPLYMHHYTVPFFRNFTDGILLCWTVIIYHFVFPISERRLFGTGPIPWGAV